jgi:hypothetical protein
VAEQFLVQIIFKNLESCSEGNPLPDLEIMCFTTHKTDWCIYHAHADCHGKTWYDWVSINFLYGDGAEPISSVPGQILMFVDFRHGKIPFMDNVDGYVGPGTYAVVRCLDGVPTPLKDSVLLQMGKRHNELKSCVYRPFSRAHLCSGRH